MARALARSVLQHALDRPDLGLARGTLEPGRTHKRIVVSVEAALFDRVNYLAAASGVSFAEAVRQLLDRGLQASGVRRALRSITPLDNPAAGELDQAED